MTNLIPILLIPFAASAFVSLVERFKKVLPAALWYKSFKPFDCAFCLSFWATVIYYQSLEGLFYGLVAAGVAKFID